MISERRFAASFGSFWAVSTPFMENFVRALNIGGSERFEPPFPFRPASASTRAMISDLAHRVFRHARANGIEPRLLAGAPELSAMAQETRVYVAGLEGSPATNLPLLVGAEISEAILLASRLEAFFGKKAAGLELVIDPQFRGCGFLDGCVGDVLAGDCLYEIKAVDRAARAREVRQLLIYAALNDVSKEHQIRSVALVNPRRGTFALFEINAFTREVSKKSAYELFGEIVDFISGSGISR